MKTCSVIEIVTPKKFVLRGLWFGPSTKSGKPKRPKRAIIWVHGLGGSAFSKLDIVERLARAGTTVITFNNRGHDRAAMIARKQWGKRILGGAAHEVFVDCVDDIQGAVNFARKAGVKNIYLAGHSTGCQKSVYWASRKNGGRGVKGIVLLAPISDYAAEMMLRGKRRIAHAAEVARALIRRGKKHELLPAGLWHEHIDAQRFLSLYTPESVEEIFSYSQPKKDPRTLRSIRTPLLVLLAGKDEYGDRPAERIAEWFEKHVRARSYEAHIIPHVPHSFVGSERKIASIIKRWISAR